MSALSVMTRNKSAGWLGLAALLLATAVAADDARDLLRRMSEASMGLNYRGTFVYMHNGQLEAMQVVHRAAKDGEQERLVALTGEAREVLRDKDKVTCILPNSKAVMVDKSIPRKPFPSALPRDLDALTDTYEFAVLGEDRVSGRAARIVAIRPLDEFRYGFRLWLERDKHLLLKSELIDSAGKPIEQMMFTAVEILDSVSDAALQPALQGDGYQWHQQPASADTAHAATLLEDSVWSVTGLPAGYMRTHHNRHAMPTATEPVEHMVFSDGLATVSVYIEPWRQETQALEGFSSMGAVSALGTRVGDYQVTVVGEVPRVTVERIAQSVRHR